MFYVGVHGLSAEIMQSSFNNLKQIGWPLSCFIGKTCGKMSLGEFWCICEKEKKELWLQRKQHKAEAALYFFIIHHFD